MHNIKFKHVCVAHVLMFICVVGKGTTINKTADKASDDAAWNNACIESGIGIPSSGTCVIS
jgi:hypothetical protein